VRDACLSKKEIQPLGKLREVFCALGLSKQRRKRALGKVSLCNFAIEEHVFGFLPHSTQDKGKA
tara:strand:- start:4087 stop:4278 length:192 start_codon:yes stop_codon:yes gene_type:complete